MSNPEETTGGNPEIGMQGESLEAASDAQSAPMQDNSGSKEFFNQLDQEVNGQIIDTAEATQQDNYSGSEQVTHSENVGSNNAETQNNSANWEKRYADSSREAVRWRDKFKSVEPFVPVLEAMKKDSGLVEHVRDYLQSGGAPAKSIQQKLDLPEDFVFDQHEAMTDPDSDSAKMMNAHVDTMVQQRVGNMLQTEKARAVEMQKQRAQVMEEQDFMKRNNMTPEQFSEFKAKAQSHRMTLDDINYLVNREKVSNNVAQSTKQDMLNQMKNVRNMPTSASGANSQNVQKSEDREVFENILGFDNGTDNLFG